MFHPRSSTTIVPCCVSAEQDHSKHAYTGPIWLAHMRVAQMGPIWDPHNSRIKKKEISTYTQTKKIRPIFMALYLFDPIKMSQQKYTKMFIKRPTHKRWWLFDLIFLSGRVIEPKSKTAHSTIISKLVITTWHILC